MGKQKRIKKNDKIPCLLVRLENRSMAPVSNVSSRRKFLRHSLEFIVENGRGRLKILLSFPFFLLTSFSISLGSILRVIESQCFRSGSIGLSMKIFLDGLRNLVEVGIDCELNCLLRDRVN
jgi:hypothetical protein